MNVKDWIHSRSECEKRGIETNGKGGFWLREDMIASVLEQSVAKNQDTLQYFWGLKKKTEAEDARACEKSE